MLLGFPCMAWAQGLEFDWRHPYAHLGFGLLLALLVAIWFLQLFNRRLRHEVEQRWRIEDQLTESRQRLAMALQGANLGCWDWDMDQDLVYLDAQAAHLLGQAQGEGRLALEEEGVIAELFQSMRLALDQGELEIESKLDLNGRSRWLLIKGQRLSHENSNFRALGTLMDISDAKAYREELEILSITDPLTGVYNRRHFSERLQQSCSQLDRKDASVLSLAMLDIDHFKQINDQHGHTVGDRVLAMFASVLNRSCRPYDLIARYGGEEFVVLFPGINRAQAKLALQRHAEQLLQTSVRSPNGAVSCTFSAGVVDSTELAQCQLPCNEMVEIADQRMYQAKQLGRNRIEIESLNSAAVEAVQP